MKPKVLLIGWDAADWKIIGPLMAKGQMPALKRLIEKGVYGNMSTMNPPYSPMLWSTVATGKTPDKHGVLGFIELLPDMKGVRPVTVNSRKAKAVWNILHNQGLKSNLVGWWPSFPAEPINGIVVSDKFQKANISGKRVNRFAEGTTSPNSYIEQIKDLKIFPDEITEAHILPFMPDAGDIKQDKDKSLVSFAKIMAENASVHAAATRLLRTTDWDFMAIYYDLIDHFCHAFMKYHPPKLPSIPKQLFDMYKDNVVGAYRFQDMMLDRVMELVDDNTTIIVMSDHGYESGHRRILKMPKYPAAPALEHRQFGIFVAAGPNIKKNEKVFGLGLVDIAPTILHMFNLPVGKDMDGNVALDIFKDIKTPEYIESWENVVGDFGQHNDANQVDSLADQETIEQLVELGYIERPDDNIDVVITRTRSDTKHNLARVYMGKNEYLEAERLLKELVNTEYPLYEPNNEVKGKQSNALKKGEPIVDKIPYYMDLLTISMARNDFDAAEEFLNELRSRDKKFEINTYSAEAKIMVAKGKYKKALNVLEKAKGNSPNAKVWFEIGKIYATLKKLESARDAFKKALEIEVDFTRCHQALAKTLIELGNYEEAAEHALTSIELVKYFPEAHYTLGVALEKLGDTVNAKIAFETAARLKPQKHVRAEQFLENLERKSSRDENTFQYWDNQIVIVSGLPRSGTSMMMQMLNAGGVEVLTDGNRKSDTSNPKGYFEFEPVKSIYKDNSWLEGAQNKAVKVVAPLLKYLNPKYRYKVIFMNRDLIEIIKSQQKMLGRDTENLPLNLFEAFKKQLKMVEMWKEKEPGVDFINIDYRDVLNNGDAVLKKITAFIGVDLNTDKMQACIDKNLYRNRSEGTSKNSNNK